MVGFNQNNEEEKKHLVYETWMGRFGHFPVDSSTISGCLNEVDMHRNIVKFLPVICYIGGKARIEYNEAAEFNLKEVSAKGIIPLTGGLSDLQDIVKQNNVEYSKKNPWDKQIIVVKR